MRILEQLPSELYDQEPVDDQAAIDEAFLELVDDLEATADTSHEQNTIVDAEPEKPQGYYDYMVGGDKE